MEGFFEANRVVEVSLSKLTSLNRGGDLPLRKTLLISKVLNTAQDEATSAQNSLLSSPQTRCTSKLLASFGHNQSTMDSLPANLVRIPKYHSRQQSPIAVECRELQATSHFEEESMDFENVSSILEGILEDLGSNNELSDNTEMSDIEGRQRKALEDLSNLDHLNCWGTEFTVLLPSRPVSPGKRNYQQAFPFGVDRNISPSEENFEDLKRFKSSTTGTDSLPSYLSTKNLQTAPFITYMFGKGFTHPGNPDLIGDWPDQSKQIKDNFISSSNSSVASSILVF